MNKCILVIKLYYGTIGNFLKGFNDIIIFTMKLFIGCIIYINKFIYLLFMHASFLEVCSNIVGVCQDVCIFLMSEEKEREREKEADKEKY